MTSWSSIAPRSLACQSGLAARLRLRVEVRLVRFASRLSHWDCQHLHPKYFHGPNIGSHDLIPAVRSKQLPQIETALADRPPRPGPGRDAREPQAALVRQRGLAGAWCVSAGGCLPGGGESAAGGVAVFRANRQILAVFFLPPVAFALENVSPVFRISQIS